MEIAAIVLHNPIHGERLKLDGGEIASPLKSKINLKGLSVQAHKK